MSRKATVPETRPIRRYRVEIPRQHGAWAFLAVPLLIGFVLVGVSWIGGLFAATWMVAYPASYFAGRAVTIRWRRGSWTRMAVRERRKAMPWSVAVGVGGMVLLAIEPWLIGAVAVLVVGWVGSISLSLAGRERGFANDSVLICQSLLALPLLWMITANNAELASVPSSIWWAMGICGVYFTGSVIHVKSLIRESADRRWRVGDVAFHGLALTLGLVSAWMLVPFGACFVRALAMRPGLRPSIIGAVEIVMSVLIAVFTIVALR